jgi:hypothetical protein
MRLSVVLSGLVALSCSSPVEAPPEPVCVAATTRCGDDGVTIEVCAEDGLSYSLLESCGTGASCIDSACQCPTRQVLGADGCLTPGIVQCPDGMVQGELQCGAEVGTCGAGEVQVVGACVAVGVKECPSTGWVMDPETGGCKVPEGECLENEDWVIGEGCVATGPSKDCGSADAPWGKEEVTGDVVFVWADSPQANPDGSQSKPYTSLAEGLAAVADGGTIRLGKGTYAGGLIIDKSVTILGKCADSVFLDGGTEVQPPDSEVPGTFGLYVLPGNRVELAGFTLLDSSAEEGKGPSGIFLEQADESSLYDLRFQGLAGAAIDLHDCHDVQVHHVAIEDQTVKEGLSPYAQSGFGVYVLSGSGNTISYSRFVKTKGVDIKAVNCCPDIAYNHFEMRGGLGGLPPMGIWVEVCPGDTTNIVGNTFSRKMTHSILFESGSVNMTRNTITNHVTDYDDLNGPAVKVVAGDVTIQDNNFYENQYAAINLVDSKGTIEGNRIDSGLPSDPGLKNGDGIILKDCDPGPVIIKGNTLVNNTRNGILATGTIAAITNNVIAKTQLSPSASSLYGSGINIVDGSDATIKGNSVAGNRRIGIRFDNAYGWVEENVIADTVGDPEGRCGGGIVVGGAKSSYLQNGINRNLFANNACSGLSVDNSNVGTISGNIFLGGKGKNGTLGLGAIVWNSATDLTGNWFLDNEDSGLLFHASSGGIMENVFQGNGIAGAGAGLIVQDCPDPRIEVHENSFIGNGLVGALVRNSQIEFRRNALIANLPNADGIGGAGAWFEANANGEARANYVAGNLLAGLVAFNVADLTLSVNYIANTLVGAVPGKDAPVQLGEGILAVQQSFVSLLYNVAIANKYAGLACINSEGIIKGNALLSNGGWGMELVNSQMTVDVNLFRNNVVGERTDISDRAGPPEELGAWEPCVRE